MYTLIINNDNSIVATIKTPIMQKSSLVDSIHILVPRMYHGTIDMTDFRVVMEYVLPVSKKYKYFELELNSDNYDESYLEFVVNGSTEFTSEAGDVKFTITFYKLQTNSDGKVEQLVRKTQEGVIHVNPITIWSDLVPDEALTPLDQRLIALEAMAVQYAELQKQHEELLEKYQSQAISDIKVNDNSLHLTSASGQVGDGVAISDLSLIIKQNMAGIDIDGIEDGNVDLDAVVSVVNI